MLTDANTGREVTQLPRRAQQELDAVLSRLDRSQVEAMTREINRWADQTGNERTDFFASSWKTGSDWSEFAEGVFQPLYEACLDRENAVEYAGWMFGWLVRSVMIDRRSDNWLMYKNPEAGSEELSRNMWGTFYWREVRH